MASNPDPDPPLDADGKPFPAVWVYVAETSYYCYADNCARAVAGTRTAADMPAPSVRQADCSSYMHTTVTPAPVTTVGTTKVTTTAITTTKTVTAAQGQRKREAVTAAAAPAVADGEPAKQARAAAATIPTYASFCTEQFPGATPHYSSACNCWSITASSTTLPPQTVTQTATRTVTQTDTVTVTQAATTTATSTTTASSTTTATATATATVAPPVAGCAKPGNCNGGTQYYPNNQACPAPNGDKGCVCGDSVEGTPTCYMTTSANCDDYPTCSSSSQCAQGKSCTRFCCNTGICVLTAPDSSCPNPSFARAIFARKRDARADVARSAAAAALDDEDEEEEEEEEEGDEEEDGEEEGEEYEDDNVAARVKPAAPAAAPTPPVYTSVIMCLFGPCGTTTITGSPTATAAPAQALAGSRRGESRGHGNGVDAFEAAAAAPLLHPAVSTYTSVITCLFGPCGTTTVTVQSQATAAA
ncbi:hypothetical protein PG991_012097 [Apiospora marii]|uniref:Uncharacterized protein n=1 Tax=Apiospora marii TaxID=335849 RepID=A0ABR1RG32_9PEZI